MWALYHGLVRRASLLVMLQENYEVLPHFFVSVRGNEEISRQNYVRMPRFHEEMRHLFVILRCSHERMR